MRTLVYIGIIGDYDEKKASHLATVNAIRHAAKQLGADVNTSWLPTLSFSTEKDRQNLEQFDAIWASPGSPYVSMEGAIHAIKLAREMGRPFIGTCGGFQHTLLEYARNVVGITDAGHTEIDPDTGIPLLVLVSCAVDNRPDGCPRLWGKLKINVSRGSLAFRIYRTTAVSEPFNCNYELNPDYRLKLEAGGLKVSGESEDGGARIIELPDHKFFIASGFMPQLASEENKPHPLIVAYLKAALKQRLKEGGDDTNE